MNQRRVIIPLLILSLLIGAGVYLWQEKQNSIETNGDPNSITAFGNVDIRQVNLGFRVSGRVEQLLVDEGEQVTAGQLIATLDSIPFSQQMALQQAELAAAEADYQKLQAGFRDQEIKVARAAVQERQVNLNNLQAEFRRRQALVDNGSVTRQSFDDIRAQRDAARAGLESAKEQLTLMEEGYRKEEIDKARAQVAAKNALLELAKTQLSDTRLYAPSAGTILTRVLEPGAIAAVGQTIVSLAIADPAWVRAYISEQRLGYIAPGMPAEIISDSRPDRPYRGHIGFISPQAEFTPKNVATEELRTRLVFQFRIIVDNPDNGLRQGMPVTVKLPLNEKPATSPSTSQPTTP